MVQQSRLGVRQGPRKSTGGTTWSTMGVESLLRKTKSLMRVNPSTLIKEAKGAASSLFQLARNTLHPLLTAGNASRPEKRRVYLLGQTILEKLEALEMEEKDHSQEKGTTTLDVATDDKDNSTKKTANFFEASDLQKSTLKSSLKAINSGSVIKGTDHSPQKKKEKKKEKKRRVSFGKDEIRAMTPRKRPKMAFSAIDLRNASAKLGKNASSDKHDQNEQSEKLPVKITVADLKAGGVRLKKVGEKYNESVPRKPATLTLQDQLRAALEKKFQHMHNMFSPTKTNECETQDEYNDWF